MSGVGAAVAWRPVASLGTRAAELAAAEPCSSGMPWPEPGQRRPYRRLGALGLSACLGVAAAVVGGAVELAPLEKRPRPGHRHRSRWRQLALVRSSMPENTLVLELYDSRPELCTWIKFLPSALVTSGCNFGVVKV